GWCEALHRFGTFPLADVMEPAIRHASRGFRITPYLSECINDTAPDLARDAEIASLLMPGGTSLAAGARLVMGDYAEALRMIARAGADGLQGGPLGDALAGVMAERGGYVTREDLVGYRTRERTPLRGLYRGHEIVALPPPAASGVHMIQMLNILEAY